MDIVSAINERSSIRCFTGTPVSREVIERLLQSACKAPSASNQQPWNFIVVGGQNRDRLVEALLSAQQSRGKHYDPSRGKTMPAAYVERSRKLIKSLRTHLDAINVQAVSFLEEGSCSLYGAPVLILVAMEKSHMPFQLIDIGCAVENVSLAAHAGGLGTCIIGMILMFGDVIREQLALPDDREMVVGIALGYPDRSSAINQFRAPKEDPVSMTQWIGFD
jgi:nitroreductase